MDRRDVLKWMGTTVTGATVQPAPSPIVAQSGSDTVRSFDPAFATAVATADAIRKKRISARELLDITLQRIDRYNQEGRAQRPDLVAYTPRQGIAAAARQVARNG